MRTLIPVVWCIATFCTASSASPLATAPGYVAKTIDYWAEGSVGVEAFFWISNDQVLFAGKKLNDSRNVPHRLVIWDTETSRIEELMELGVAARLCYDRGYIHVWYERAGNHTYAGNLGEPLKLISSGPQALARQTTFNRHTCRVQDLPKTNDGHGILEVLREDHGYIEAERPGDSYPQRRYFLVRPSGERITTTLRGAAGGPRFSAFAQGYVFQDGGGAAGPTAIRHLQVLHIDGRVSVYKLPAGEWMRGSIRAMPAKVGVLMTSLATRADAEGAYIVKGEHAQRIVKGYIRNFAISPNGCKVAMSITRTGDVMPRMSVLNVCEGGN